MKIEFLRIENCLKSIIKRINRHPKGIEQNTIDTLFMSITHIDNRFHRKLFRILLRALRSNQDYEPVLLPI